MMERGSLQAIRSRVERLAEACGGDREDVLVIHWMQPYDNCPSCGYNLDGHARDEALAKARDEAGPETPIRGIVFYWWPRSLSKCPKCSEVLP
jgi:hypothetical protein